MTQRILDAASVAAFHAPAPGITEALLERLRDADGEEPYDWLASAVAAAAGPVLDVACGSAPLAGRLADRGYVGVDLSEAELRTARGARPDARLVRGDALALPLRGPFGAAVVSMALFLLTPLERALGELARVLAPGAALAALVPDLRRAGPDAALHAAVVAALGRADVGYPEPLPAAGLPARFAASGFALVEDVPRRFVLRLVDDADIDLVVRSYYAPADLRRHEAAAAVLRAGRARAGGSLEVGYGLRRLVARRLAPS